MSRNVFVGRQPIFDRNGNIYAYELLYRNSDDNHFPNINPEEATIELLVNTFVTIGFDQVVNRSKSFINFSEKLLFENAIEQLDTKQVVIELLEDVAITPAMIARLKQLKKLGFTLVLDDFMIQKQHALYHELYQLIHIIKVDFMFTSLSDRKRIEQLKNNYRHITLLAEKVETQEEYEDAQAAGYLLFQGYYFAKPDIVKGKEIITNQLLHLNLFRMLNQAEPDIDEISNLIKRDVSMSYKLLRHINSFAFNIKNEISSIKQAIMLMGLKKAKKWMQILLLYNMGEGKTKGREKALIIQSLTRAKMCELLAMHTRKQNPDEYFLAGMFSLINIIMYENWEWILSQLSLSELINDTLLGHDTEIQAYLQLTVALEEFNLHKINQHATGMDVSQEKLSEVLLEAHWWVLQFN